MKKQKYNIFAIVMVGLVCLFLGTLIGTIGSNNEREYESMTIRIEALENEISIIENQMVEEKSDTSSTDDEAITQTKEAASAAGSESATVTASQGETVWKTKSGKKYHKESCGSLSKSSIAISIEEANAAGLEPCKKCFK